jgi:hypothetical protein
MDDTTSHRGLQFWNKTFRELFLSYFGSYYIRPVIDPAWKKFITRADVDYGKSSAKRSHLKHEPLIPGKCMIIQKATHDWPLF